MNKCMILILLVLPILGYSQSDKFIFTKIDPTWGSTRYEQNNQIFRRGALPDYMIDHPDAAKLVRKGINQRTTGLIIGIPSAVALGFGFADDNETLILASSATLIIGSIFELSGRSNITKSIDLYNHSLTNPRAFRPQLNFGPTHSGVGMHLRF